jgi:hypothetical protein
MSRLFGGIAASALAASVIAGVVSGAPIASPFGTWHGVPRDRGQGPGPGYPPITLVVGPVRAQIESTGPTTASHDSPDATSTCTTRYRYNGKLSTGGWRLYFQEGVMKVSGPGAKVGGPPSTEACGQPAVGHYRFAVRLRPAGAKLLVEFGALLDTAKVVEPRDFDPTVYPRAYLHR